MQPPHLRTTGRGSHGGESADMRIHLFHLRRTLWGKGSLQERALLPEGKRVGSRHGQPLKGKDLHAAGDAASPGPGLRMHGHAPTVRTRSYVHA